MRRDQFLRISLPILFVGLLCLAASQVLADEPYLVADINPNAPDTVMSNFFATEDLLFFRAYLPPYGHEPWRSDGTASGTFMIEDLNTSGSSTPALFGPLSNQVVFAGSDGSTTGLFRTAGGVNDISLVKDSFVTWLDSMAPTTTDLFYGGSEIGPLGGDRELWKLDGTTFGMTRVKDIHEGSLGSNPEELVGIGNTVYFTAYDWTDGPDPDTEPDLTHGEELWRSDGTELGTQLVEDINLGEFGSTPTELTDVNGWLFFMAVDDILGAELCVVKPGVPGVTIIDICSGSCGGGAGGIAAVGNLAYFRSIGDGTTGGELWRSNGTDLGTWKVKEIGPGSQPAYISRITDLDGTVFYFIADDGVNGEELWRSDGTGPGTRMVKDINPEDGADGMSSVNSDIATAGGLVYFSADDGINGFELWRSDGTETGTVMVKNLNPAGNAYPHNLNVVGDLLLFTAFEPDHGTELWALPLPMFADGFETGDTSRWSIAVP